MKILSTVVLVACLITHSVSNALNAAGLSKTALTTVGIGCASVGISAGLGVLLNHIDPGVRSDKEVATAFAFLGGFFGSVGMMIAHDLLPYYVKELGKDEIERACERINKDLANFERMLSINDADRLKLLQQRFCFGSWQGFERLYKRMLGALASRAIDFCYIEQLLEAHPILDSVEHKVVLDDFKKKINGLLSFVYHETGLRKQIDVWEDMPDSLEYKMSENGFDFVYQWWRRRVFYF